MVNEYKAELVNGELIVKPKIIKAGNDVTIQVPNIETIEKAKLKYLIEKENGKWNI